MQVSFFRNAPYTPSEEDTAVCTTTVYGVPALFKSSFNLHSGARPECPHRDRRSDCLPRGIICGDRVSTTEEGGGGGMEGGREGREGMGGQRTGGGGGGRERERWGVEEIRNEDRDKLV